MSKSRGHLCPEAEGICVQKQEASDAGMLANRDYSQPRTMKPTIAPIRRLAGTAMASEIAIGNVELDLAVGSTDQSSGSWGMVESESDCLSDESGFPEPCPD